MDTGHLKSGHRLVIRNELRVVRVVELQGEGLTIGRSARCDITLPHDAVSRRHARLERRDDTWYVVDTESVNGLRVNGRQAREASLTPGDVIEIRPFAINYVSHETTDADRSIQFADRHAEPTIVRDSREVGIVVRQRLDDLYALSRLVIKRKDNGSFWQDIHAALQRSLAADRCILVGADEATGFYRLAPRARPTESSTPLGISRSVLNEVVASGRGLLIQHILDDERFARVQSLSGSDVGSVICVPILVKQKARAIVYADRQVPRPPFEEDDLDFVIAAVDLASTAADIDELQACARELSRVRGRIDAAREMQEMLLPCPIPQPDWGQVAAVNYPADQMSGDIYDALIDAEGRLVVSIADVAGKGVPAAFATAILQDTCRHYLAHLEDLGDIVRQINRTFDDQSPVGCFATMVMCRWSPRGDSVEIANAGHHAPLWLTAAGDVEPFPERIAFPLGVNPLWTGRIVRRDTSDSILVLLSSDGVTEARNPAEEEYGLSRLARRLRQLDTDDARAVIAGLLDDVKQFCSTAELADDVTLLVVKRKTSGTSGPE